MLRTQSSIRRRSGARVRRHGALVAGTGSTLTTFAMDGTNPMTLAPAAYGAILLDAGFAVFSPVLLRALLGRLGRPIEALDGVSGYLTVYNMLCRVAELSGALMLINSLYAPSAAASSASSASPGPPRGQVLGMVGCEALVLTVTGVVLGTTAGLAGIVPFTYVRTDQALPGQGLGIWLGIVAVATAATLVTSLGTARRTLRTPAVDAVTVAA